MSPAVFSTALVISRSSFSAIRTAIIKKPSSFRTTSSSCFGRQCALSTMKFPMLSTLETFPTFTETASKKSLT